MGLLKTLQYLFSLYHTQESIKYKEPIYDKPKIKHRRIEDVKIGEKVSIEWSRIAGESHPL